MAITNAPKRRFPIELYSTKRLTQLLRENKVSPRARRVLALHSLQKLEELAKKGRRFAKRRGITQTDVLRND